MSKKKGSFGKLLAFATTAAAIGGVCYVFRDKILESPLYQSASDKVKNLFGNSESDENFDDEDFFFDEEAPEQEESTSAPAGGEREYISITSKDDTAENPSDASEKKDSDEKTDSSEADQKDTLTDASQDADVLEEQDRLDN